MWFPEELSLRAIGVRAIFVILVLFLPAVSASQEIPNPSATQTNQATDALEDLRKAFRSSYNAAVAFHEQNVVHDYPVITQDLLNMTLIRSTGETERFSMDRKIYFLMANTSHPPMTIYSIISKDNFGKLAKQTLAELEDYSTRLANAKNEVNNLSIDPKVKARVLFVLTASLRYVKSILRSGKTSLDDFEHYAAPLRRSIQENLYLGAKEQLEQFKEQMNKWRFRFPEEKWNGLRVVVLSFHQEREKYALYLFFKWLLREPNYERRVVYAEFQSSISGAEREKSEKLALILLTKVDFELEASSRIFGSPQTLQVDVMGPAAIKILSSWGKSTWPE